MSARAGGAACEGCKKHLSELFPPKKPCLFTSAQRLATIGTTIDDLGVTLIELEGLASDPLCQCLRLKRAKTS